MRNRIIETLALIFFDALFIFFSFALAYYLRLGTFSHGVFHFGPYIQMGIIMVCIWVFFLAFLGRYSLQDQSFFQHLKHIIIASFGAAVLFPLLFYFQNDQFFSRGILALLFFLGSGFLLCLTFLFMQINKVRRAHSIGLSKMLVIGANRNCERIIKDINAHHSLHCPVAILTPYGSKKKEIEGVKVYGKLDALERVFDELDIDEIFLGEGIEHSENLASFARNKGIPLRTSFETIGILHPKIEVEHIGSTPFLTLQQSPLFGWGQLFKRIFDVFFALLGLCITAPYVFLQRKNIKEKQFQNGIDSTFTGWVIEKNGKIVSHKIPLLLSVLKKDVSIIGPTLYTSKTYKTFFAEKIKQSESRFVLRPGLFSAQPINPTPESQLRMDILYIRNWTFWTDMRILLGMK